MTMAELARMLATNVDAPVIDATALTGVYQFKGELPLDASFFVRKMLGAGLTTTAAGTPLTDPTGVSIFHRVAGRSF